MIVHAPPSSSLSLDRSRRVIAPPAITEVAPLTARESRFFPLLGLASWLFVRLIGYITLAEVYIICTTPFRVGRLLDVVGRPTIVPFAVLWILWCLWVPIADIALNRVPFELFARGMAKAACCGLVILTFYDWIRGNLRRLDWYLPGYAVSHLIGQFVFRDGGNVVLTEMGMAAKWGWEGQTNYVVTSFAYAVAALLYRRYPTVTAVLMIALGCVNLANGARSAGAIYCIVGALLLTAAPRLAQRTSNSRTIFLGRRIGFVKLLLAALVVCAGTYGLYKTYGHLARSGTFGERARKKFESQDAVKGGAVVGGRFGFFVGLYAVAHKPVFGHGSWATDNDNYVERTANWMGVEVDMPTGPHFIPSHSMIVTSWVDHGIAGGLFWIYVFVVIAVGMWRAPAICPEYTAFIWLTSGLFLWALLFSPIHQRMYLAVHVAPILVVNERWRLRRLAGGPRS